MGKRIKKIDLIQQKFEKIGLSVERDNDDENPCLYIRRKPTSKKSMFELVFDKKGNLINLVAGPKQTKAAWIDLTK
jgi:hypothetical protein